MSAEYRNWAQSTSEPAQAGTVAFLHMLLERVPELAPVYAYELSVMEGEMLPHGIMGGIASFAQDAQMAIGRIRGPIRSQLDLAIDRLLGVLEEGMRTGDESVRNMILLSFLENIGKEQHCAIYSEFTARFGPALKAGLDAVSGFWGPMPGCE